jgi:hypothetical protein
MKFLSQLLLFVVLINIISASKFLRVKEASLERTQAESSLSLQREGVEDTSAVEEGSVYQYGCKKFSDVRVEEASFTPGLEDSDLEN